jgi:Rad51 protein
MSLITEVPTLAVPEVRSETRKALTTSVPTLDRLLGSFEAGKVTLIDSGSDFVFHLTTLLCVRAVMEGGSVVFVDGGNSVDPHGMVALGKRAGLTREEVLPKVHVARAFTCHQMTTLLLDMLDRKLEETDADLAVLACLPEMYLDEDVAVGEAHALFQRSLRAVRKTVADREVVGLVTNAGLSKLYRRRSIRRQLYESVDRVVRIAHGRSGVLITRSDAAGGEWYLPVSPHQRTLDDFEDARPRIVDLAAISEPRAIRNAEHMRFSW